MSISDNKKWVNNNSYKYVNFPILLLKDAISDIHEACNDVLSYALYECTLKFSGNIKNKIESSQHLMRLNYPNSESDFERGKFLYNLYSKGYPKAGIKYSILIDFLSNNKTEFEMASFLGYCATRSIVQNRAYVRTTNLVIKARMNGFSTGLEYGQTGDIAEQLLKYEDRYHMDKLKNELKTNWGLKIYGFGVNGFYISYKPDISYIDLAVIAKSKTKRERLKIAKAKREIIKEEIERRMKENINAILANK